MNLRDVDRALMRWRQHDLISEETAEAILAFEAAKRGEDVESLDRGLFDAGTVLAYAGVLVALLAMAALHVTLMDHFEPAARCAIASLIAIGTVALAFVLARAGGGAIADALGFAATVLVAWAAFHGCDSLGLLETAANDDPDTSVYLSALLVALISGAAGWALARTVPAPLAAVASSGALAAGAAALGWMLTDGGALGGQLAVIAGFALAAVALVPGVLGLDGRARRLWPLGALITASVAAFLLAAIEGGLYEGLLLPYAIGTGAAAIVTRQRALLAFAALFLYAYVGFVVFRTFGGAIAAIIVLALIGLGTALGGTLAQRGLVPRLFGR